VSSLGLVGFAVGGDHALIDGPGRFDLDVLIGAEQVVETLFLLVGEQVGAGVQHPAGREQGVAGAVAVEILLDAAPALVERVAGEADHMERVMPTSA